MTANCADLEIGVLRVMTVAQLVAAAVTAQGVHPDADEVRLVAVVKNGHLQSFDVQLMRKGLPLGGFGQ